jgi:hypothetical protein
MFSFLKSNPIFAGIIGLVLIAGIIALIGSCERQEDNDNANLVNQGAVIERDAAKTEVIESVQNAKDAVDNPTSNDLNIVCSKYDRNCQNN